MPPIVSLLVLAFAVSLDGFGVGATYGLRKIRIPLLSIAIISSFSGVVIFLGMQIGLVLSKFLSPHTASSAGALILLCIGVWTLIQNILQNRKNTEDRAEDQDRSFAADDASAEVKKTVLLIKFKQTRLMIQVLRTPAVADVDHSGNISSSEAALLGMALSFDAFGAGIGAALIGFSPYLTAAVISVASGIFLALGLKTGFLLSEKNWMKRLSILPGIILILMGIMKLLQ